MAELSESDLRLIARIERHERATQVWACVLMLLGMSYAAWGVLRFDPRAAIEDHMSFDRPVSSLGELYGPYAPFLRLVEPKSDMEEVLMRALKGNMAFGAGVMITLMRVFLGLLMLVMGMVALSVSLERRRLLNVIARSQAP